MNQQFKQSLEDLLRFADFEIPVLSFSINLMIAALLSIILRRIYIQFAYTLSNRRSFSRNFILITMTTMLIITIVKSSLALSLGLVGALSIVRFRSAIKEPEELGYLFLTIAIGLGLGANQLLVTLIGFSLIIAVIILGRLLVKQKVDDSNLNLTISWPSANSIELDDLLNILKSGSQSLDLKRLEVSEPFQEASFIIEFEDVDQLNNLTKSIREKDQRIKLSFLDTKGIQ